MITKLEREDRKSRITANKWNMWNKTKNEDAKGKILNDFMIQALRLIDVLMSQKYYGWRTTRRKWNNKPKKRRSEQINEANDQMTKRASNNKIYSIKYGDVFFKAILVIN